MKAYKINCPYCGGNILSDIEGLESVYCNYCGQKIFLDDGKIDITINKNINVNKTIHKRYTDDADVIRAKSEAEKDGKDFKQLLVLMGLMLLIPIFMSGKLFFNEKMAEKDGKINAGYYNDLIGKDYETVFAHFESAGFTDIELIDLDDSGVMFWKEGEVETISVGGKTSFDSTDWFEIDTKVVISYH